MIRADCFAVAIREFIIISKIFLITDKDGTGKGGLLWDYLIKKNLAPSAAVKYRDCFHGGSGTGWSVMNAPAMQASQRNSWKA